MPVTALKIGDVVLVRTGEKIPVDGIVVGGQASVDQAPITGESVPQDKTDGAEVFAGTVVESGALDPGRFITRTITLEDTPAALMAMSEGTRPGVTIIRPSGQG